MSVIKIYPDRDFTTAHNDNIWDLGLSNETVGFWIRCISMKPNWDFYVTDLAKRMNCSKKNIYKNIKILELNRYCLRWYGYEKSGKKFSKRVVKYIFFSKQYKEEDKAALEEELKKCYGSAHFGNFHDGNFPEESLVKKNNKKKESKENNTSAAADFASFFLSRLKEKKPDLTKKEVPKTWLKDCEKLLKIRDVEKVKAIVEYIVNGWWLKNILSPGALLDKIDRLEIEMAEAQNPMQKNSQASKIISQEIVEKRMKWAEANTWTAPGGSAIADNVGYHLISGNGKPEVHYYNKDEQFWKDRGL